MPRLLKISISDWLCDSVMRLQIHLIDCVGNLIYLKAFKITTTYSNTYQKKPTLNLKEIP